MWSGLHFGETVLEAGGCVRWKLRDTEYWTLLVTQGQFRIRAVEKVDAVRLGEGTGRPRADSQTPARIGCFADVRGRGGGAAVG